MNIATYKVVGSHMTCVYMHWHTLVCCFGSAAVSFQMKNSSFSIQDLELRSKYQVFPTHNFEILGLSHIWFETLAISSIIRSISKVLVFSFKGASQSAPKINCIIWPYSECIFPNTFFYKQSVYKQLVLGWKIAKQLSGLNSLSLGNNENCSLKQSEVFSV